jgi:hypothetical protein
MKRLSKISFSGRCCAGQLSELVKKAAEHSLDAAHQRTLWQSEKASRKADSIPALLLALLLLAALAH